jgi:hypothetical protein
MPGKVFRTRGVPSPKSTEYVMIFPNKKAGVELLVNEITFPFVEVVNSGLHCVYARCMERKSKIKNSIFVFIIYSFF